MDGATFKEADVMAKRRVMVVEDEPIIREFVCELLSAEGYEIEDYESADEAFGCLKDHADKIDLLITDIRMPGELDGADLTNLVLDQWPSIRVIVMSGHETPETAGIASRVAFLPKPWSIGQLIDSVQDVTAFQPVAH
ncbi:response regulator [Pseudomonas sp. KNUC1026]|uniref:response regulator n=1 Tax=Pseudomonas sp. KNUC1026 TaxID=2893890 RepID=UPI001F3C5E3B|nr:response regulator [Pseudomonas sp. KNUC1026]UFH51017.1 response regulator [Pseudomonas sp. KNUC1026]